MLEGVVKSLCGAFLSAQAHYRQRGQHFPGDIEVSLLAAYTHRNENCVLVRSNRAMTVAAQNGRPYASVSPAGDGPHQQERLRPRRDGVGQRGVRRFMRQILSTGEEPHKRTALVRDVLANRPAQHRIAGLERVEDRALRGLALDLELHLAI